MGAPRKIDPARLDAVEALYAQGFSARQIEAACAKKFGVKRRQVRRYLAIVRARLAAHVADAEKAEARNEQRGRIYAMLERSVQVALDGPHPNPTAAANAAVRIGELLGVMAPKKIELGGRIEVDRKALADELNAFFAGDVSRPEPDGTDAVPRDGESDGRGNGAGGADGGGAGA